jgi:RND family efflux transporter MFP subunit
MKHYNGTLVILALLSALVGMQGCHWAAENVEPEEQEGNLIAVKLVAAAQVEVAKTTHQPASVFSYYETEIRARVSGYVSELAADIGDVVKTGDVLARVDVPELDTQKETLVAQIDLLLAEEQLAEAGVELADAALRAASANVEQVKSQRASAEASLAAIEAEFQRTEDLVNRGTLQNRMLDEVRKKRDSELATIKAVLSAISAAEAEVAVAVAERAAAQARQKMAKANTTVTRKRLDELQVSLRFATIIAPFDGLITERHINLGDLINGRTDDASKPLFRLSKVDRLRIHIPVPESDAPFVQSGDSIKLTFPSFASEPPIRATVTRRTGSLNPNTRTMTVEAEIGNPDGKLMPGMFGQAHIELEPQAAMTMLPSRAVRFDDNGRAFVYLIDSNNRVQIADVSAGMDTGTEIEILSGIMPGDQVIGAHLKRFSTGQQVRPL